MSGPTVVTTQEVLTATEAKLAGCEKRRLEVESGLRSFAVNVAEALGCDGIVTGEEIVARAKATRTSLRHLADAAELLASSDPDMPSGGDAERGFDAALAAAREILGAQP